MEEQAKKEQSTERPYLNTRIPAEEIVQFIENREKEKGMLAQSLDKIEERGIGIGEKNSVQTNDQLNLIQLDPVHITMTSKFEKLSPILPLVLSQVSL